jgi:hypothetical protein
LQNDNSGNTSAGGERLRFSSLVHRTDFILAVVILAVCGTLYYITTTFDKVPAIMEQNIPPEWFPRLLLAVIALLTVIIPFEHLFLAKGKKGIDEDRRARIKPISIYSAILLCCIVGLMPWLGTLIAMVLVCALLPPLWGESRLKVIIPFAVIFPGLVALLFMEVLGVYFEPGIWAKLF